MKPKVIITEGRVCAVSSDNSRGSMGGNGIEFCARGMEESKSTSTTRSLRLVSIGLGVVGRTSNQNCAGCDFIHPTGYLRLYRGGIGGRIT